VIAFESLADYVLAPLAGRSDAEWFQAPEGKWPPARIVDHVAAAIETTARGFASRADHPPMTRRRRTPAQFCAKQLVFTTGWFPPGRKSPASAVPAERPDPRAAEARLRGGVAAFLEARRTLLPRRATDLFAKHPVFGDLTLDEFTTFHILHAAHHRRQIVERLG